MKWVDVRNDEGRRERKGKGREEEDNSKK